MGLILRGRGCRDIPPVQQPGRAEGAKDRFIRQAPEGWLSLKYLLTITDNSLSHRNILFRMTARKHQCKFILPLEEGEQLRVNYYPSKHQSSSIPPPYPNTDHKVILQLDLKQTFHVSISLLCCVKKNKKKCSAYKTTSVYLISQDGKCYICFGEYSEIIQS